MAFTGLTKRVLIVDDETNVAVILAENLEAYSSQYQVDTAENGKAALAKLRQTTYDLMITDYKMPGMDGLELARAARQIAPELQIILMSAYGSENLRDAADKMRVDGFVEKPFSMDKIRKIVEQAIARTSGGGPSQAVEAKIDHSVQELLQELQANTGARCVLLLSSNGFTVETAGQTNDLDITTIGILVAANFIAASELARQLGKSSVFKSSYFEGSGESDNIYAHDINQEFLLTVVFGAETKPGSVWYYAKHTAANLLPLMAELSKNTNFFQTQSSELAPEEAEKLMIAEEAIRRGILPPEFGQDERLTQALNSEVDQLFGDEV